MAESRAKFSAEERYRPLVATFFRRRWRDFVFPGVVCALFILLVGADLNGSSIGVLSAQADDPSLLAGSPRPIRSDEYMISTPMAVGATRLGFPAMPWVGFTPTQLSATAYGGPTGDWSELFRPQDWGYYLLGASRGLSFHWWFAIAICLVGVYLLLRVISLSRWLSVVLSCAMCFCPYVAWWSIAPAEYIGFGALATASFLIAVRSRNLWISGVMVALAAYFFVALVLGLYVPWIVGTGYVCVALLIGQLIDRRESWRRLVLCGAGAGILSIAVLGFWYIANRTAIQLTAQTNYPGGRASTAGGASLANFLSAPANFAVSLGAEPSPPNNLSELSSTWLPFPVIIAAIVTALYLIRNGGRGRAQSCPVYWTTLSLTVVAVVLTAWAFLPLPAVLGKVTLLDRLPPSRVPIALGFAALLLIAVCSLALKNQARPSWLVIVWIVAIAATVAASLWAIAAITWEAAGGPSALFVALSAAIMSTCFVLLLAGRYARVAGGVLIAYCLCSWAIVNPLYQGLGPLKNAPLVVATRETLEKDPTAVTANFGSKRDSALLMAAGAQPRSFVTMYPNPPLMSQIFPDQKQEWNNYANYTWVPGPAGSPAFLESVGFADNPIFIVHIDPCGSEFKQLGITWVVSPEPLKRECLREDGTRDQPSKLGYRYRVVE